MQKILDMTIKSLTAIFFTFFLVGGVVVLCYCIRIGYFPTGIDVGDSLFFISVALRFTILYIAFVIGISTVSIFLVRVSRYTVNRIFSLTGFLFKRKAPQINWFDATFMPTSFVVVEIIVTVLFGLLFIILGLNDFVISMIASILIIAFTIGLLLLASEGKEPVIYAKFRDFQLLEERRKVYAKGFLLVSIFFSPLLFSEIYVEVSRLAFLQIGVAKRHSDIYLDKKMESVFNGVGTVNNDYLIIKNADILWTGVGSRSVIEVDINDKPRRFVVNTDEMLFSY